MPPPLRLVLDTNVWLDWLVFDDPDVAPLKAAAAGWRVEIWMDQAVEDELARVLEYPFGTRSLAAEARAECLAACRRIAKRRPAVEDEADTGARARPLPVCADPDDQKFLDLALACEAAYLVTRDRDLLELARFRDPVPPFRIVTPRQLAERVGLD